ncbi:MAG: lysine--tRNA ligase, partial [Actinobacteria bacterium]|nr:lysine--tRNA ligase [Actinomycetota bacterium]
MSDQEPPYRFDRTAEAGALHERYAGLPPETNTSTTVAVAGRLMLRRVHGALAFGTLADSSGRIQLFATAERTPRFEEFCHLAVGDWLGVTGEVVTTRRGELSVAVSEWVRLAHARRSFPDRWHGLADPDVRYRQRYVDLWVTEEARRTFLLRSRLMALVRRWLEER